MTTEQKSTAQHTPGPWEPWFSIHLEMLDKGNVEHRYQAVLSPKKRTVALVPDGETHDLRLIAAAPDLLAALKEIESWDEGYLIAHSAAMKQIARAAIEKAEGAR